jgi:cytoskeletal protein CcmA (bactofilin family)
MTQEKTKKQDAPGGSSQSSRLDLEVDADFDSLNQPQDSGFFSKLSNRFNDALQSSRGSSRTTATQPVLAQRSVDDIALVRARTTRAQKMFIPDGVIIEGSLTGGSETEIHGRIEGNVTVDGALFLGKTALVTGNVRAGACQLDGMVEGKIECSDSLLISNTGRLAADAVAGKLIRIAGHVEGNAATPGALRIESGGVVNGDIKARVFSMDEGAVLNGRCTMRAPSQQEGAPSQNEKGSAK